MKVQTSSLIGAGAIALTWLATSALSLAAGYHWGWKRATASVQREYVLSASQKIDWIRTLRAIPDARSVELAADLRSAAELDIVALATAEEDVSRSLLQRITQSPSLWYTATTVASAPGTSAVLQERLERLDVARPPEASTSKQ